MNLQTNEEYIYLVEELQAALVEGWKTWEESRVRSLHGVGEIIATHPLYKKYSKGNTDFLEGLARDIRGESKMPISRSRLYECIQVYEKFPDVSRLLETLNNRPSWSQTIKLLNPPQKATKPKCRHCKIHCS